MYIFRTYYSNTLRMFSILILITRVAYIY